MYVCMYSGFFLLSTSAFMFSSKNVKNRLQKKKSSCVVPRHHVHNREKDRNCLAQPTTVRGALERMAGCLPARQPFSYIHVQKAKLQTF